MQTRLGSVWLLQGPVRVQEEYILKDIKKKKAPPNPQTTCWGMSTFVPVGH